MATYAIMEGLMAGPKSKRELTDVQASALPDLFEAEWVSEGSDGMLSITDDGRTHLKSF